MKGKRKSRAKKLAIIVLITAVALTAVTYAGFSAFFRDHYFYHTKINGIDYSYKTPVEAEEMIYEAFQAYSLEIFGREETYDTIFPAEIDMELILDHSLAEIKNEQRPSLWILGFFKEYSYDIPGMIEYNEEALDEKIERLTFFQSENIRAPSDAYVKYSSEEKRYIIMESSPGTDIIKEKASEEIKNALIEMEADVDLDEKACYQDAAVKDDDAGLLKIAEEANKYASAKVTYDWNGNEVIVDADTIRNWVILDTKKVSLNEEKIKEFVDEKAEEYDTYGKNRIFNATDGREIELKSGAYGWMTNREEEYAALLESVKKGETAERKPCYSYTAAEEGQKDIGNSYVEIDLGSQHLYLYVNGVLILESDFVSGNASRGWSTPAGVFGLTYKTKNAVLRGDNYETPVSYWMPFNGNIGMHDATWRASFGGEIYKTNGSHGCINLPFENAKLIYEYMYTGFPVVCYY